MKKISTETKSELLKYKLLQQSYDYDMMLYDIIVRGKIEDAISLIDERTFFLDVPTMNGAISAKQFLFNFDELLKLMKLYFYNIAPLSTCVYEIIGNNRDELENLLKYECRSLYSFFNRKVDPKMEELLCKIIIKNFISNAKYVAAIEDILKDLGLSLKAIEKYSLDESKVILNLISDIVFCQRGRGPIFKLFESIDYHIDKYKNNILTNKRKIDIEKHNNKYINSCIEDYNKMITSYYSKKKYLKYFI